MTKILINLALGLAIVSALVYRPKSSIELATESLSSNFDRVRIEIEGQENIKLHKKNKRSNVNLA